MERWQFQFVFINNVIDQQWELEVDDNGDSGGINPLLLKRKWLMKPKG